MRERTSNSTLQRQRSAILIQLGLIASLLLLIGLFSMHWTVPRSTLPDFSAPPTDPVVVVPSVVPMHDEAPRRPPPPVTPMAIDEIGLDEPPDFTIDIIELPPIDPGVFSPPAPRIEPGDAGSDPFIVRESEPQIVGGIEALQANARYPEFARRVGIEGIVYIEFTVDETGRVSDLVCLTNPGGGTCEAAMEAVRRTEFLPGIQGHVPVSTRITLPVRFRLR